MEGDFSIPDSSAKAIYCSTPYFLIAYVRFTMAGRPAAATNIVPPNTVLAAGSMSDGSGGTWSCSVEAHVGRRRASTDELAGRTRVATQQLHVPSVSSAVQLGCAGGFPGRISLEMPSVPASSQRAEGFFFQEQLAPGKVDVDAPLVGVRHPRAPRCLAS